MTVHGSSEGTLHSMMWCRIQGKLSRCLSGFVYDVPSDIGVGENGFEVAEAGDIVCIPSLLIKVNHQPFHPISFSCAVIESPLPDRQNARTNCYLRQSTVMQA